MARADNYEQDKLFKLLFIGNSGAGKTGALTPLVEAGYNLRIIDLDNGLAALFNHVKEKDPKLLRKIEFQSFRDQVKMTATGMRVKGAPTAYAHTLAALERWPDDESDPAEWGDNTVLVLDSLTNLGRAAFQWAKAANPATKDPRQWYKTAQDLVEDLIANLTSESFQTNVIVISHIELTETKSGTIKGFASSIGQALGPKLPRFFNTLILSEVKGSGSKVRRTIQTLPTSLLDLKTPAPMRIEAEYPLETGLLEIVEKLKNDT